MDQRWIKASEIGEYQYCRRAWWYRLQGAQSANAPGLALGTQQHARHGRGLRLVAWQRLAAVGMILVALILLWLQVV